VFDQAQKVAEKAGDSYVTVERLLLALALEKDSEAGKILARAGVSPQNLNAAINALRKDVPPTPARPRTPMTRSRNMPVTSPRRRATARSTR
jgi:ATP-dependent Clp protease ATP-binding subunit ClpA